MLNVVGHRREPQTKQSEWRVGYPFSDYVGDNRPMGGAMYGTHNPDDHEAVRRQNTLDAAEGFGPVATRASSPGTRESTLEGPISSPPGKRVVARFVNDDGSGASECLVTLKPAAQRLSPTQILETLEAELSNFARTVLGVEDEGPIGRALELTSGKPAVLRIDGSRREGWLLQTRDVHGIACRHADRIVMWLGVRSTAPSMIFTEDLVKALGRMSPSRMVI